MVHISGLTREAIDIALENTNKKFEDNIIFNRIEKSGFKFIVTLKVNSSSGSGARRGFTGRKMINACWHVYGVFFDECFALNPSCTIKQCGQKVTPENNWTDINIGSIMRPMMYSDACKCGRGRGLF
jgi:hypothetical protein